MKRFSKSVISLVILITLLLGVFVSCKTTTNVIKDNTAPVSSINDTLTIVENINNDENNNQINKDVDLIYPYGIIPTMKSNEKENSFNLLILHTNDINSSFYPSESSIGLAKLSNVIKEVGNLSSNLLVLDAGNNTSSIPFVRLVDSSFSSSLLNMIGYDAVVPTENDYINGVVNSDINNFQLLSANVLDENNNFVFQPYQIYRFNEFNVAVIGLSIPFALNDNSYLNDTIIDNAQDTIDLVSKYADYVIVLANLNNSILTSKEICAELDGIDLFVENESHTKSGSIINETVIVNSKSNLGSVGVVSVNIEDSKVTSVIPYEISVFDINFPLKSNLLSSFNVSKIEDDDSIISYIEKENDLISNKLNQIVFTMKDEYDNSEIGKKQTQLSRLLCSETTKTFSVDGTLLSANVFKTDLKPGDVSYKEALSSLTPNDSIVIVELSGSELYSLFEEGYKDIPKASPEFIVSDFKVIYNRFAKVGERILRVKRNNKNIEMDDIYSIATVKEISDRYGLEIKRSVNKNLSDILINYFSNNE